MGGNYLITPQASPTVEDKQVETVKPHITNPANPSLSLAGSGESSSTSEKVHTESLTHL